VKEGKLDIRREGNERITENKISERGKNGE
jgi:hypothetical protein